MLDIRSASYCRTNLSGAAFAVKAPPSMRGRQNRRFDPESRGKPSRHRVEALFGTRGHLCIYLGTCTYKIEVELFVGLVARSTR